MLYRDIDHRIYISVSTQFTVKLILMLMKISSIKMDYEPLVEFADDQEPAQVLEESIPYENKDNGLFRAWIITKR